MPRFGRTSNSTNRRDPPGDGDIAPHLVVFAYRILIVAVTPATITFILMFGLIDRAHPASLKSAILRETGDAGEVRADGTGVERLRVVQAAAGSAARRRRRVAVRILTTKHGSAVRRRPPYATARSPDAHGVATFSFIIHLFIIYTITINHHGTGTVSTVGRRGIYGTGSGYSHRTNM